MLFRKILQKFSQKQFSTKTRSSHFNRGRTVIGVSLIAVPVSYGVYHIYQPQLEIRNEIIQFYERLPFNALSRFVGKIAHLTIPKILRKPIYKTFSYIFVANLDEMENPNLEDYKCLCEFFCRRIDMTNRPIDVEAILTSPADGSILYLDRVINGNLQQVKGFPFTLDSFLCLNGIEHSTDSVGRDVSNPPLTLSTESHLYFCTIYLAPGDYHCFHTPADWNITARRYVPGRLMSVNPIVSRRVQDLFVMNERVAYLGQWKHGFFCYSAIGATNVGNIRVYSDDNLVTNTKSEHSPYYDRTFYNNQAHKGAIFGEFRLGSTVLLIFEAPPDFEFCVKPGDYIKVGQALSKH